MGILAISVLILMVFTLRLCIPLLVKPGIPAGERQLQLAWEQLQSQQDQDDTAMKDSLPAELFYFDPNTLDSSGFIRLGLSARTTHMLLNWRAKGKRFYHKEDLRPLYTLSTQDYQRLEPFISISGETGNYPRYPDKSYPELPPLPDQVNLNRCDSATLVRLPGIGPYLARKILERREALGGFLKPEQLLEVYRFPDSSYQYLKEHLLINPGDIRKIGLNTATEERLGLHPYIGAQMAANILLLRKGLDSFRQITQLRQVPLMNEEKYRKIAAYCTID